MVHMMIMLNNVGRKKLRKMEDKTIFDTFLNQLLQLDREAKSNLSVESNKIK